MIRETYWLLMLFIFLLLACGVNNGDSANKRNYDYQVRVVSITDGDTFRGLTKDKKEIRFRIHGIDAPEKNSLSARNQSNIFLI